MLDSIYRLTLELLKSVFGGKMVKILPSFMQRLYDVITSSY